MKNLKNVIHENKALIGTIYGVSCWYGFCYLAGKGTAALLGDHFKKHPASKGKMVVTSVAAAAGAFCLANFLGDLVGESLGRYFGKEARKLEEKKLEVIKNDPEAMDDMDDMDDSEVV